MPPFYVPNQISLMDKTAVMKWDVVTAQHIFNAAETDLSKLQLQYRRADATMRADAQKTQSLINKDK